MTAPATWHHFQQVANRWRRNVTLVECIKLTGGISAESHILTLKFPNNKRQRVVVRQLSQAMLARHPHAAQEQFQILQTVHAAGVAAPEPLAVDETNEILPRPYLLLSFMSGQPDYAPSNPIYFAQQMARQLTRLHRIDGRDPTLSNLPDLRKRLGRWLAPPNRALDDSLREGRIRKTLTAHAPLPPRNRPSLLHGDFWPGNLLWQNGKLMAIVDWEDAQVGDPLSDVAITRLDLAMILGRDAMRAFTETYARHSALNWSQLPAWDLLAALRPAGELDVWAAGWSDLGRDDISHATFLHAHQAFVNEAFDALDSVDD